MKGDWPPAVAAGWHPVARYREMTKQPLARTLMGVPLVLFHGSEGPVVFEDRCPHRSAPLSAGSVEGGILTCPYHGWTFGDDGRCIAVAGAESVPDVAARKISSRLKAGLIWVALSDTPAPFPNLPAELDDMSRDGFWWVPSPSKARLLDAIENLLDPAHPHFVHTGIVRSSEKRRRVDVTVTVGPNGAEAVYHENARADGLIPRLLEGRRLRSVGRFIPPTIGQVAFEVEDGLKLAVTVVFCPIDQLHTQAFAHFSTMKSLWPAWLKRLALIGLHWPVLRQDRLILAMQSQTIEKFGGAEFEIGPLDLMGPTIWRLANGDVQREERKELVVWL